MAEEYDVTPQTTASILDTFSCVFQGVIPYGAQMLIALSTAAELDLKCQPLTLCQIFIIRIFFL